MMCTDENRSSRANEKVLPKGIEKKPVKPATVFQGVEDVPKPLTEGISVILAGR